MKIRLWSLLFFILIISFSSAISESLALENSKNIRSFGKIISLAPNSAVLRGVNLACYKSMWEGWNIKDELENIKGYGFNTIRLNLYWRDFTPDSYDSVNENAFTTPNGRAASVDDWVKWCNELDMNIIILLRISPWSPPPDWAFPSQPTYSNSRYWDLMMSGQATNEVQSIKNIWAYIADRYKDNPHVLFDIWNEPRKGALSDSEIAPAYKEFAEEIIDIIRARETVIHLIIVEEYIDLMMADNIEGDGHVYRSFHWYAPWEKPYSHDMAAGNRNWFESRLNWLKATGLKVMIGEFGRVLYPEPHVGSEEWFHDAFELFNEYGIEDWVVWNYAYSIHETYSIVNSDGTLREPYFSLIISHIGT